MRAPAFRQCIQTIIAQTGRASRPRTLNAKALNRLQKHETSNAWTHQFFGPGTHALAQVSAEVVPAGAASRAAPAAGAAARTYYSQIQQETPACAAPAPEPY